MTTTTATPTVDRIHSTSPADRTRLEEQAASLLGLPVDEQLARLHLEVARLRSVVADLSVSLRMAAALLCTPPGDTVHDCFGQPVADGTLDEALARADDTESTLRMLGAALRPAS